MGFGTKEPEVKTKRESFADALAKYRETEAALKNTVQQLSTQVATLRQEVLALEIQVSDAKIRRDNLLMEIGHAVNDLAAKQNAHLVWVSGVLSKEKEKLDTLIAQNEAHSADLINQKRALVGAQNAAEQAKSEAEAERARLAHAREELTQARIQEREAATEDRKRLDAIIHRHNELVSVLEAREKQTRPEPRPITLKKGARR